MSNECALTTIDNPYDPFTQFSDWFMFDIEHNYDCCGKLDRFAVVSDEMSSEEKKIAIENAIDEIIKYDFLNIYQKVVRKPSETDENETTDAA